MKCIYDLKPEFFFQLWTIFISGEFLEKVSETMRHPRYCLAHHPGISSNITNTTHFSTPPATSTLAHWQPYPHWYITTGLSPIIMNEVFNFHENERYNFRSGIHLAGSNMYTAHCVLTLYLQSVTKYCGTTPFSLKICLQLPYPPFPMLRECENCLELLRWLPGRSGRPKT